MFLVTRKHSVQGLARAGGSMLASCRRPGPPSAVLPGASSGHVRATPVLPGAGRSHRVLTPGMGDGQTQATRKSCAFSRRMILGAGFRGYSI